MRKQSALWLSLCVSSLAVTVSLIAGTTVRTSATPDGAVTNHGYSIAQANPCASKNPCASTNPCASKNPCASTNPCASKTENVGGALAQQLQGKPVVVDIYASWCAACKNIAPTLSQLKQDYGDKAHFVVLDVSDKSKASEAESKAAELGLTEFLAANKSQTGMVAIVDPATGDILTQHRNNANLNNYTSVLDSAISQM
jgi:thiol-disulfide isomerase/thioredoxin